MAVLFNLEIALFEDSRVYREELSKLGLNGHEIVEIIDGKPEGSLNFNNIQRYLNQNGLMPYDSEIISFLRRIDRDDDGVITGQELQKFLDRYFKQVDTMNTKRDRHIISTSRLECLSPGRKIVQSKYKMIQTGHRHIPPTDTAIEKSIVQGRKEQTRSKENTPRVYPEMAHHQQAE